MTVLIVDNHRLFRTLLKSVLGDLATEIREATDGVQALEVYAAQPADWVLMDLKMQPLDGLTATRELLRRFPQARVVLLSSYDETELRAAAQAAGAIYVAKDDLVQLRQILCS